MIELRKLDLHDSNIDFERGILTTEGARLLSGLPA
jgi:hypothetical protein